MKKLYNSIIVLLLSSTIIYCQPSKDYSGSWFSSGKDFEYNLTLEKLNDTEDTYRFYFFGWKESFDPFTNQNIKFPGIMDEDAFIIKIQNQKAKYSDDLREFTEDMNI